MGGTLALALALVLGAGSAGAQAFQNRPATDSSALSSPAASSRKPGAPATDASVESSPLAGAAPHRGASLPAGIALKVRLDRAIDSGRLKNGDTVPARLTAPVRTSTGAMLPAGTPAAVTVVETVPAGRLSAVGEFSLQLVRVGGIGTATDVRVFRGQPGHKDVADAAPALGTDAGLPAGASLTFRVLGMPDPASGPPARGANVPGAVDGVAPGGAPPSAARSNSGEPVFGGTAGNGQPGKSGNGTQNGTQQRPSQPADNTFGPAQHTGQPSTAPNQPSSPATGAAGTAPQGSTTQSH